MTEINRCYEILGVGFGVSSEELKRAYRRLVKAWHPDRFTHDPRLQQRAENKLKEINVAYERVQSSWHSTYSEATQEDHRQWQEPEYEHSGSFEEETTKTNTAAAEESKHGPWIFLGILAFLSPLFAFLLVALLHDTGNSVDIRSVIPALVLIYWIYSRSQRDKKHL